MLSQSYNLESSESMAITFIMQKNDQIHDTVIHVRSDDSVLCLLLHWARLVNRIWTFPGASLDTFVCTVWRNGHIRNTSPLKTSFSTYEQPAAAEYKALILVLSLSRCAPSHCNQEQWWKCILGKSPSTPACSLAVIKWCLPLLRLEAGGAILVQCCHEDVDMLVVLTHPRHCSSTDFLGRLLSARSLWQCQDEEKYWRGQVTMGASVLPLRLIGGPGGAIQLMEECYNLGDLGDRASPNSCY
jgi:hypothetical protein